MGLQSRKAQRSTCKLRYEPPRVGSVAAVRLMAASACRRAPDQRALVSSSGAAPGAAATPAGLRFVPSAAAMRVGRVRAGQGGFRDRADCDGPGLLTENRNYGSRGSFRCLEALLLCTLRSHADHGRPRTDSCCTWCHRGRTQGVCFPLNISSVIWSGPSPHIIALNRRIARVTPKPSAAAYATQDLHAAPCIGCL